MLEVLQTFSRMVLAFLSGALLMIGTTFWADVVGGSGSAFEQVMIMLKDPELKIIFTVITGVTAYIIGIINFAASSVAFRPLVDATQDELLLVSRLESLQQPQLLKEVLELLHVKRTLVAFTFPLFYFGMALACDFKQWPPSPAVAIASGVFLTVLAGLAPFLALRMNRLLDASVKKLSTEMPNQRMQLTGPATAPRR
jgi:hypothetical protein